MVSSKVLLCLAILPFVFAVEENQTWKGFSQNFTEISVQDNPSARCYDYRLANFINTGLQFYSHNMGQLSKYILDQIVRARMPGYWLVHSEMIGGRRQGLDWQDLTNGDLFASSSSHGCYYHDTQTYIIILRY